MNTAGKVHTSDCQKVTRVLARIGDKWSVLIIMMLAEKPLRFNELRRVIGGISQRMLTLTLRGLERDGLVTRHLTPVIPPRVDYQLTDLGRSLFVPVRALGAWAKEHGAEIERAQVRFDRTKAADAESLTETESLVHTEFAGNPGSAVNTASARGAESSGGVKSSGATPMRAYPPMDSP